MKTVASSKGQIVLPAEFRQMDGIEPGQEFDVSIVGTIASYGGRLRGRTSS